MFVRFISEEKQNRRCENTHNWKTQNIVTLPFNCNNTTQDNKKTGEALIDEEKGT